MSLSRPEGCEKAWCIVFLWAVSPYLTQLRNIGCFSICTVGVHFESKWFTNQEMNEGDCIPHCPAPLVNPSKPQSLSPLLHYLRVAPQVCPSLLGCSFGGPVLFFYCLRMFSFSTVEVFLFISTTVNCCSMSHEKSLIWHFRYSKARFLTLAFQQCQCRRESRGLMYCLKSSLYFESGFLRCNQCFIYHSNELQMVVICDQKTKPNLAHIPHLFRVSIAPNSRTAPRTIAELKQSSTGRRSGEAYAGISNTLRAWRRWKDLDKVCRNGFLLAVFSKGWGFLFSRSTMALFLF